MDNLRSRRRIIVNACLMCLKDVEVVNHLFLNCSTAQALWKAVIGWFGCNLVFPWSISASYEVGKFSVGSSKGRSLRRISFMAILWVLWKERNSRCFEGQSTVTEMLINRVKFCVACWALTGPHFWGISIGLILSNWKEVAFTSWHPNHSGPQ